MATAAAASQVGPTGRGDQGPFSQYGDLHRAFLQAMMIRGAINGRDLQTIIFEILDEYELSDEQFDRNDKEAFKVLVRKMITKINSNIRPCGMEIRRIMDERTGRFVYALLNLVASEDTVEIFKDYTQEQLEYFKIILAALFEEDDRSINYRECLNLTTRMNPKRISMEAGEVFLERMIADKWLEKENGAIRLHVRGVYELEPYLKKTFELQECNICKSVVLTPVDQKCPACGLQAHRFCISRLPRPVCPNDACRSQWPQNDQSQPNSGSSGSQRVSGTSHPRPEAEGFSEDDDVALSERGAKSLRRIRMEDDSSDEEHEVEEDGEDEEEDEEEEDEEEQDEQEQEQEEEQEPDDDDMGEGTNGATAPKKAREDPYENEEEEFGDDDML